MNALGRLTTLLNTKPTSRNMTILFGVALFLRLIVFFFYMQHNDRYKQGDTPDYHSCAVSMANGRGMFVGGRPRFWRAPGYPFYLKQFYQLGDVKSYPLGDSTTAQKMAILIQILIVSLLPLVIFYLALLLTKTLAIAWIASWISVFHIGIVLASSFLMTDIFGALLFYLYLICFYSSYAVIGEKGMKGTVWWRMIALAAVTLGIFTYIRPMGNYIWVVSMFLLLVFGNDIWSIKLKKFFLFTLIFFAITGPWYVRNYQLTGKWFFCPMWGLYFNTFVAPKVSQHIHGGTYEENWKKQVNLGNIEAMKVAQSMRGSGYLSVPELDIGRAAWPLIMAHPFRALHHWMGHVFITLFDTYSNHHLVDLARGEPWEPLEPTLLSKFQDSLYREPMNWFMRMLSWLEFFFFIFTWIGILGGFITFMFMPLLKCFKVSDFYKQMAALWLKVGPFIGAVCFMTGGYGYARLRLPVDMLIIILSLTFWYWLYDRKK